MRIYKSAKRNKSSRVPTKTRKDEDKYKINSMRSENEQGHQPFVDRTSLLSECLLSLHSSNLSFYKPMLCFILGHIV